MAATIGGSGGGDGGGVGVGGYGDDRERTYWTILI